MLYIMNRYNKISNLIYWVLKRFILTNNNLYIKKQKSNTVKMVANEICERLY